MKSSINLKDSNHFCSIFLLHFVQFPLFWIITFVCFLGWWYSFHQNFKCSSLHLIPRDPFILHSASFVVQGHVLLDLSGGYQSLTGSFVWVLALTGMLLASLDIFMTPSFSLYFGANQSIPCFFCWHVWSELVPGYFLQDNTTNKQTTADTGCWLCFCIQLGLGLLILEGYHVGSICLNLQ